MNTKTRFFNRELLHIADKKSKHQHLDTREKAVYCFCHLDGLEDAPNYLHKLIVEAAERIYNRRNQPNLLSFGHNEAIMIERLYQHLK